MAWEKRRKCSYYYRTIRQGGRFKRLYYGAGPIGNLAAQVDALRMAECRAEQEARRAARAQLESASALTDTLHWNCEMLAAATLLLAGFHRASRHSWRTWRHGRRITKECI